MSEIKLRIVPHSEEPCEECGRAGDINARFNAPHYCDNPTCPGNINRQKLEMFEKIVNELENISEYLGRNTENAIYSTSVFHRNINGLLDRIKKIGGE